MCFNGNRPHYGFATGQPRRNLVSLEGPRLLFCGARKTVLWGELACRSAPVLHTYSREVAGQPYLHRLAHLLQCQGPALLDFRSSPTSATRLLQLAGWLHGGKGLSRIPRPGQAVSRAELRYASLCIGIHPTWETFCYTARVEVNPPALRRASRSRKLTPDCPSGAPIGRSSLPLESPVPFLFLFPYADAASFKHTLRRQC